MRILPQVTGIAQQSILSPVRMRIRRLPHLLPAVLLSVTGFQFHANMLGSNAGNGVPFAIVSCNNSVLVVSLP